MQLNLFYLLEHGGVVVAAITGVLAARGKRIDLFGVIVLALATAFGGGTLRDATIGSQPVFWVRDPNYVLTAVATAIIAFFIGQRRAFPHSALQIADAFVLGFFTIVGLEKALAHAVGPVIGVAMGVITGVAGGMVRDVLVGEIPMVLRRDICLYATAALIGAVGYTLLASLGLNPTANSILAIAIIVAVRLAGIRWNLGLPVFADGVEPDSLPSSRNLR